MSETAPAVHRSIICVDVANFGSRQRTNSHQVQIRKGLHQALDTVFERTGIFHDAYKVEDRGDGALILISPEVPKIVLATDVMTELTAALDDYNHVQDPRARIRLRAALHAGEVVFDDYGVTGAAVNLTFRLLDAGLLRLALATSPSVLALIASHWFYEEVIYQAPAGAAEDYEPVHVSVKETSTQGWVRLLGQNSWPLTTREIAAPLPKDQLATTEHSTPKRWSIAASGHHVTTRPVDTGAASQDPPSDPGHDGRPGPLLARMRLAVWLRQLRTSAQLTREQAATAIGRSAATLGRWERAESGADPTAVEALLALYGMHVTPERARILSLVQEANTPGWIHGFRDVLTAPEAVRVEMEQTAQLVRTYHHRIIPPVLQTPEYARAVGWPVQAAATRHERCAELLWRCQQILHRSDPLQVWSILDEAALRYRAVPAQVMRRQLRHLLRLTELPHVTVQLIAGNVAVAAHDPFTIFRFTQSQIPDVVRLECPTGRAYLYHRDRRYDHQRIMDRLGLRALQPEETIGALYRFIEDR
jgi:transcriptional regulator with XRE-family HTH domain